VGNIVRKQGPQFKELYHRLVVGLPGVHWPVESTIIQQDVSPRARSAHLKKLPSNLLTGVKNNYSRHGLNPELEADESVYWVHLAGDERLPQVLTEGNFFLTPSSLKKMVNLGLLRDKSYSEISGDNPVAQGHRERRCNQKSTV
jgi:translocator assembly and maintenance protein 41